MEYKKGAIGRVFVVRFDNGDDFLEELKRFAEKENISFAAITFLGALASGSLVVGPEKLEFPATGIERSFNDGREIFGTGTIIAGNDGYQVHIHAAVGRGEEAFTACVRGNTEVFITIEALVTEITGIRVGRKKDKATGHVLLTFEERD